MGTPNNELLDQLRGAISTWTAEVGAAQEGLFQQIAGANTQLNRLLPVLEERRQLTAALSRANEALDQVKQVDQHHQMPAGSVTRYSVGPTPTTDAAMRELDSTVSRLQTAVQSWTSQVAHSRNGLLEQFATANRQLAQLLDVLAQPAAASRRGSERPTDAPDPAVLEELEQLRHENRILSAEVHALNIDMETFRHEQEAFAAANLSAESERAAKHRRELEKVEQALADREAELTSLRRDAETRTREAEDLRKENARLQRSEQNLQNTVELQRQETAQHVSALGALSHEMEALRRAFLGEDVQIASAEGGPAEDDEVVADSEALAEAEARIGALQDKIDQLENEREEAALLKERVAAMNDQLAQLEARPTVEELAASLAHATELESRIDAMASELAELSTHPTPEDFAARTERVTELEERVATLQNEADLLAERPEPGALDDAQARIAALEDEVAALMTRLAATGEEQVQASNAEWSGLRTALATMEAELATLKRREDEAMTTARTLLVEMETHRTYEAAQATALSEARNEAARLQDALMERQQQIAALGTALTTAEAARDALMEELENERSQRERRFVGTADGGKSAAEALESREERGQQQEILLSELTQRGESRTLGDILVDAGVLTRGQLSDALDEQRKDPTQLLGTILIEREYTTDDAIAQAVACQLGKPVVNPMEIHVQREALDALHRDLCTWHVCIPLRITEDRLVVAMANPLDETAILKLRDVSQREITPVVGTPSHIMGAIDSYYGAF